MEKGETDRPSKKVVITPFLSGVRPAGTLRAEPKPFGTKASGLVQVGTKLLLFRQNAFVFVFVLPSSCLSVKVLIHAGYLEVEQVELEQLQDHINKCSCPNSTPLLYLRLECNLCVWGSFAGQR